MAGGTGAKRVLVVGDCATEDLKALTKAGFTVEIVASAAHALDKLSSNAYNLVLGQSRDQVEHGTYSVVADVSRVLPDSGQTFFTAPAASWQAALLNDLAENTEASLAFLDCGFNFVWVNSAYCRKCGYARDELIGRNHFELFPHAENRAIFEQVRDTGTPFRVRAKPYVYPNQPERGITYWDWTLTPIRDESGEVGGLVLSQMDVTELLTVQKQLDADRAKLHAIVENMCEGLVVVDAEGRLLDWNRSALDMHGLESVDQAPADLSSFRDMFTLLDQGGRPLPAGKCPFSRVVSGEPLRGVVLTLRSVGTQRERVVTYGGSLVRDSSDEPILAFVTMHDITEEYLAAEAVRQARLEAESRALELESIISSMADGVALFGADGRAVWANEAGRWMLGVPEGESISGLVLQVDWRDLDGKLMEPRHGVVRRLLGGETLRDAQYRVTTPTGRNLAVSVSGAPLRGPDGSITRAIVVLRDITERAELNRVRDELYRREHRIAQMLQQALVPPATGYSPSGCSIAVRYEPGSSEAEIGGDFYDVFEVSEGKVAVVIGDVAGKGLPAAIRIAAARYGIRSYAHLDLSPGAVMAFVNRALCSEGLDEAAGMLTAFFGVVDVRQRTIVYANAGHEPPLLQSRDGSVSELRCDGIALGVTTDIPFREVTCRLQPGDRILMFTDGITEARSGGEMFGEQGVIQFLSACEGLSCDEIASGLMESAKAYAGGSLQDDAAVLVLEMPDDTDRASAA